MTDLLTIIIPEEIWQLMFAITFFFGLIFLGLVILGGLGDDDGDLDHDHVDTSSEFDLTADHDMDGFDDIPDADHVDVVHTDHVGVEDHHDGVWSDDQILDPQTERDEISKHKIGNIASFSLMFGAVGLLQQDVSDLSIALAFFSGVFAMRMFAFLLRTIAKNTNNPLYSIGPGDQARIIHGLSYKKVSVVNVTRKDGIIVTVLAKTPSVQEELDVGEMGYVVGRTKEGIYLVSGNPPATLAK